MLRSQDPAALLWVEEVTDRTTNLEEGAVEPSGVGRDVLCDGVKVVQLQTLVKHSRANFKYLAWGFFSSVTGCMKLWLVRLSFLEEELGMIYR